VTPTYSNAKKFGPCKYCADYGFDYAAPATLYLVVNRALASVKVGIASSSSNYDRIAHHKKFGWHLKASWKFKSGQEAESVEESVIRWWRNDLGLGPAVSPNEMPQGGWTETAAFQRGLIEATSKMVTGARRKLNRLTN
jgi:hypothetical protein